MCDGASEYFSTPVDKRKVRWSYSGVRPLYDDGASEAQAATRDYVLELDAPNHSPAVLSVYGGKITTYRRLAEIGLGDARPPSARARGPGAGLDRAHAAAGRRFPALGFEELVKENARRYPFLGAAFARRLTRAYGALVSEVLGAANTREDLGRDFGADLTEAELRYLVRRESAGSAPDIVWRRTKLELRLSQAAIASVDEYLKQLFADLQPAE